MSLKFRVFSCIFVYLSIICKSIRNWFQVKYFYQQSVSWLVWITEYIVKGNMSWAFLDTLPKFSIITRWLWSCKGRVLLNERAVSSEGFSILFSTSKLQSTEYVVLVFKMTSVQKHSTAAWNESGCQWQRYRDENGLQRKRFNYLALDTHLGICYEPRGVSHAKYLTLTIFTI